MSLFPAHARWSALLAAAAIALLASAASASAAALPVGSGTSARVALDASGAAHVAWVATTNPNPVIDTCTIPFGGGACTSLHSFTITHGSYVTSPFVFVAPGKVYVGAGDYTGAGGFADVFESDDGGATFGPQRTIGDVPPTDATFDPASGTIYGISANASGGAITTVQAAPAAGPKETSSATLVPQQPSDVTQWAIALAGTQLVGAWNGTVGSAGGVFYGYWKGSGSVNDSANWTTGSLGDGGTDISLAGGPSGLFLLESIPGHGDEPSLRAWNGTGFGALSAADCGDIKNFGAGEQNEWAYEDSSGRLHVAYVGSTGSGGHNTLRYVVFANGSQSPPVTLDDTTDASLPHIEVRLAANGAGQGIAVWQTGFGDTSQVRAAWLPSPLPATTGCPLGETQSSTAVGGQKFTLSAPAGCVQHSGTVKIGLKTSGKRSKLKLARADLFVDGGVKKKVGHGKHRKTVASPNATVKQLPAQFSLAAGKLKAGTHKLLVRLTFKHKVHKKGGTLTVEVVRVIKATFKVC